MKGQKIKRIKKMGDGYDKVFEQKKQLNKIKAQLSKVTHRYEMLRLDDGLNEQVDDLIERMNPKEKDTFEKIQSNIKSEMEKLHPLERSNKNKQKNSVARKRSYEYSPYMVR